MQTINAYEVVKKNLEEFLKGYDEQTGLVKKDCNPNYHSKLKPGKYCQITDSTNIAAAIFSCQYEEYYHVANTLLKSVAALQCKEGDLLGLWSYFFEESLEEMVEPDWNMADFNCYPMIYVLKEHTDKLENGVKEAVEQACINACESVLRRNLTVSYVNPTVMGSYCTIVCGELFNRPDFIAYGKKKLRKLYFKVMHTEAMGEYVCPEYNMLVANVFSLMLRHVHDKDALKQIDELNTFLWQMLGEHYHSGLEEFTGPNSRQYAAFSKINIDCENKRLYREKDIFGINAVQLLMHDTKIPEKILPLFQQKVEDRVFRKVMSYSSVYPSYGGMALVDTQYIKPDCTLGSATGGICWNQKRNLISYIGDKDKKVCIRLRAYHDGYDFCSAYSATAQERGTALSITNFFTDLGDTHPNLDKVKNATISATDLRVLYQIEANTDGIIENIQYTEMENGYQLNILGKTVKIVFPFVEMTGGTNKIEITSSGRELFVSAVLYAGERRDIKLSELDSLIVVSVISLEEKAIEPTTIIKDGDALTASLETNGNTLQVKGAHKPMTGVLSQFLHTQVLLNNKHFMTFIDDTRAY